MKTLSIVLLIIALTFIIVPSVLAAQDQPLDNSELVNSVTALIAAIGALVANFVITFIKTIPFLADEDKSKLAEAVTQVVSVIVGVVTGYVVGLVGQWLGLVSDSNLQTTTIAVLTPVFNEILYRVKKLAPA